MTHRPPFQATPGTRWSAVTGREDDANVYPQAFFDEIPHGIILQLIHRRKSVDEQFVALLARLLNAGVIVKGEFEKTTKGYPQGSPFSPILSDTVLNELEHKLEARNRGSAAGRMAS